MTTMYATEATDKIFFIREVDVINPATFGTTMINLDGVRMNAYSKTTAWALAQRQSNPVRVVLLDGTVKILGVVFHPAKFEEAAYSGYVSRGIGDTDGYYAPIQFDSWVKNFRTSPDRDLNPNNTEFRPTAATVEMYKSALATIA